MAQGPCLNPSCKSNGAPHPGCKCYGGLAEGGTVQSRCEAKLAHDEGCEYYAAGGGVEEPPLPDPSTLLDAPPATADHQEPLPDASTLLDEPPLPDPSTLLDAPPETSADKYGSTGQQALTALEGAAHGFAGPVATLAEKGLSKLGVPGLTDEDIAGRAAENPWVHGIAEAGGLGAGLFTGTGEAGLIAKAAEGAAQAAKLGRLGGAVLSGAISTGLYQGGDEITKGLLGQGDPTTPVATALAHIGGAALIGGAGGGLFNIGGLAAKTGLEKIGADKMGQQAKAFLAGIGHAANPDSLEPAIKEFAGKATAGNPDQLMLFGDQAMADMKKQVGAKAFELGQKFYDKAINKAVRAGTDAVGLAKFGPPGAWVADKVVSPVLEALFQKRISKWATAGVMQVLSKGEGHGVFEAMNFANMAAKGDNLINKGVGGIFQVGGQQAFDGYENDTGEREKLRKAIEDGAINSQIGNEQNANSAVPPMRFAKGGHVAAPEQQPNDNHFATAFPVQSQLLATAKGRVSGYLNSIRPIKSPSAMPYDTHHEDPTANRAYDTALDIANKPLRVLKHVHDGTITPDHVKHLTQMYPELYGHLGKKITEQVVKQQAAGEKLPYAKRQALSLFLGAPLDSTFSPGMIMAAQPKPAAASPAMTKGGKPSAKAGTTMQKGADSHQTVTQDAEADRNSRD